MPFQQIHVCWFTDSVETMALGSFYRPLISEFLSDNGFTDMVMDDNVTENYFRVVFRRWLSKLLIVKSFHNAVDLRIVHSRYFWENEFTCMLPLSCFALNFIHDKSKEDQAGKVLRVVCVICRQLTSELQKNLSDLPMKLSQIKFAPIVSDVWSNIVSRDAWNQQWLLVGQPVLWF